MIFKYLTSIVKPCVFKLFSLRKITKSNFHHHLPTLNIANLFMQSFASPLPPHPHQSPPPHKNHAPQIKHHILYHAPHQKGATIAYTHALSTQKSIERARLSLIPTPFLPKKCRKGATIAYTHALSTQKTTERAQLSHIPTPFPPKKP